jgi:hypothetical protein
MGREKRCSKSSAVSTSSGPAPHRNSRKQSGASPGERSRNSSSDGTTLQTVAPSRATSAQKVSLRNRSHSTVDSREYHGSRLLITRPLTWCTGRTVRIRVPAGQSRPRASASQSVRRLAAVSTTPLGSPVVPLV